MRRFFYAFCLLATTFTLAAPYNLPPLKNLEAAYKGHQPIGVAAALRSESFQEALAKIIPLYKRYLYQYHNPGTPGNRNVALTKLKDIESCYIHQIRSSSHVSGTDIVNTAWIRDPGVRAAVEGSLVTFSKIDALHKLGLYGTGQNIFLIDEGHTHLAKVLAVLQMIAPHATFIQNKSADLSSGATSKVSQKIKKHLELSNVRYITDHDFDLNFKHLNVGVVNFSAYYISDGSRRAFLHRLNVYPKTVFVQAMSNDNTSFPAPYVFNMDDRLAVDAKKKKIKDVRQDFGLISELTKAQNLMFAIAVTYHITIADFSSRPGGRKDYPDGVSSDHIKAMQDMSVSALGNQILFHGADGKDGRHWGTSFAAPMISGTATLLREAFPKLSAADIIQSILRSAEKDFYIPHTQAKQCGTFVYSGEMPDKTYKSCTYQQFDPARYGRGILNAKLAYDFAAMRARYMEKSLDEVDLMFQEYKAKREMLAAKKIQKAWRGRKKTEPTEQEASQKVAPPVKDAAYRARVARRMAAKAKAKAKADANKVAQAPKEVPQKAGPPVKDAAYRARVARRMAAEAKAKAKADANKAAQAPKEVPQKAGPPVKDAAYRARVARRAAATAAQKAAGAG